MQWTGRQQVENLTSGAIAKLYVRRDGVDDAPPLPELGADVAHVINDPFPREYYSYEGVSYRIVERALAVFYSEAAVERVVLFLAKADEVKGEGKANYTYHVWFPGDFGCLTVTRGLPPGERLAVRDPGQACRPHASWLDISPEEWEAVRLGGVKLEGKQHWKWSMGDAFMEWYRKGLPKSLRDTDGNPLWSRATGERRVVAAPVESLIATAG